MALPAISGFDTMKRLDCMLRGMGISLFSTGPRRISKALPGGRMPALVLAARRLQVVAEGHADRRVLELVVGGRHGGRAGEGAREEPQEGLAVQGSLDGQGQAEEKNCGPASMPMA
jgi:hypothetical protein